MVTEKKGKFLAYLKAKAKPKKPRKPKKTFELQTTLKSFKKRKLEPEPIPFNVDHAFNFAEATAGGKGNQNA